MIAYLIWSNQRQAWWRPGGAGYTLAIEEAGRYATEWAQRIIRDATVDGQLVHTRTNPVTGDEYQQYDEVLVLSPESATELDRELEECLRELGRHRMRARGGEGGSVAVLDAAELYRDAINDAGRVELGHRSQDLVTAVDNYRAAAVRPQLNTNLDQAQEASRGNL